MTASFHIWRRRDAEESLGSVDVAASITVVDDDMSVDASAS